jgi:hypothetical protein
VVGVEILPAPSVCSAEILCVPSTTHVNTTLQFPDPSTIPVIVVAPIVTEIVAHTTHVPVTGSVHVVNTLPDVGAIITGVGMMTVNVYIWTGV